MTDLDSTCPECGAEVLDIDVKCGECGASLANTGAQRLVGRVVIEQYEVMEVLGQGGMSVVYRAQHKLTGQEVALKVLPPELAAYSQVKSRFLEEAKALAQLDHPNIVHLYNFGQEEGSFVLAMQFIHGRTWEKMILDEDPELDWRTSARIAVDVCHALEYAHERGVIHRDMKSSNVIVRDSDGSACVMDFGIAKMQTSSRLTATGQTMGTVRYMSPEQVRGHKVDVRTDVYSLCATLYESLVGDTPFDGETHFEIMTRHLSEPPVPPSRRGVEVPAALEALVMKGLSKPVGERPRSATQLREALESCLEGKRLPPEVDLSLAATAEGASISGGGAESDRRGLASDHAGRRGRLWVALAALVVAASGAVVLALSRQGAETAEPEEPPAAAAPRTDAPEAEGGAFLLPDFEYEVDRRFPGEQLRVVAVRERDAEAVRDLYVRAVEAFESYLRERGLGDAALVVEPLTVVLVPQNVLCDRRLDEERQAMPDACAEPTFQWYRVRERTLYLPDVGAREGLAVGMAEGVSLHLFLHSPALEPHGDVVTVYDARSAMKSKSP